MAQSFHENMSLAMRHEMRVRELIGRSSVLPASMMVDKRHGTDLLILSDSAGMGVAARVRRPFANQYSPWEFTIRTRSVNGGETEYQKFRSGMCRWYFYGVLNREETNFQTWMLISLDAWRRAEDRRDKDGGFPIHGAEIQNRDGSRFRVYSAVATRLIAQPGFMIDCSDYSYNGSVKVRHYLRTQHDACRFSGRRA